MESKNSNKQKILILIRHGERADKNKRSKVKCGICDPELTEKGTKQCVEAGELLIKELSKLGIKDFSPDSFNFRSSPYMRTIQTSAHLIKGIRKALNYNESQLKNVYIDYGLREQLKRKKAYEEDFLNFLSNDKYSDFDKEFKNITFINEDKDQKFSFDKENITEIFTRCRNYLYNELQKKINEKYNNNKIYILATHSGPMQLYLYCLNYRDMVESDYMYCGQFFFDISNGVENAKFLSKVRLPEYDKYTIYDDEGMNGILNLNNYLERLEKQLFKK